MTNDKQAERDLRDHFKELPYFNYRGCITNCHGRFNNLRLASLPSKRDLEKLPSLYDLDIFKLNASLDNNLNSGITLLNQRFIQSRYFSPHSFKEQGDKLKKNSDDHNFSVFHNNIVSLRSNLENLQTQLLDELDFHFNVIGFTETKITNSNEGSSIPRMQGYEFEYVPTPLSFGGVGMFIDEQLDYNILEKTSNEAFQALFIEIKFTHKKNIICGIVYRQHNSPDLFLSYLDLTLSKYLSTGKNVCLMGDFNLCLLKSETSDYSHNFLLSLQSNYLIPTIDKPTRVRNNSASLIDNILTNNPNNVEMSGNIISDISDHFSQFCIFSSIGEKSKIKTKTIRNFSQFSSKAFIDDLTQIDWNATLETSEDDVDKMFSTFYNKLNKAVNKHAPMKKVSHRLAKRLSKPWITKGIRSSIRKKNKFLAKGDETRYRYYRNRICSLIRTSKKQYFYNYFADNVSNMKNTWKAINDILNRKTYKHNPIVALKDPRTNNPVNDPASIANIINKHFASIGKQLADKIPNSQSDYNDYLNKIKSPEKSFFCTPISSAEIEIEIMALPMNKSHGLYSCPTKLLKLSSAIISKTLANIFNLSLTLGTYPHKLKTAKIIPIFKDGDSSDVNNYRPISLLSNFNKIFEKIMYKKIKSFIDRNCILNTSQYGFRESHSTEHAILDTVSAIQKNMDKGLYSCGIFIDLKKAFDTVDHNILLSKLNHYGFRGIINNWFKSYLSNRTQTTKIENHVSVKLPNECGVPQGSVLGPLLFLIYINDIQQSSHEFQFYLYADDTNILYANKDLKTLELKVNKELKNIYLWLTSNKLTLNPKKSNFVIFHPRQKKINYQPEIYICDNESGSRIPLERKDYIKYLGILIDKNLSWKMHIHNITTKISRTVGLLAKIRHFAPFQILLQIYQSLILPIISYGLPVWGQACKSYTDKVLLLQKRALRLIFFADYKQHALPLFIQSGQLPLDCLYYFSVASLMHDVANDRAPLNIMNLFRRISTIHQHNTRSASSKQFYLETHRLEIQRNSFSVVGAKIWNRIPISCSELHKHAFKVKLQSLLFDILKDSNDYIDISQINEKIKQMK